MSGRWMNPTLERTGDGYRRAIEHNMDLRAGVKRRTYSDDLLVKHVPEDESDDTQFVVTQTITVPMLTGTQRVVLTRDQVFRCGRYRPTALNLWIEKFGLRIVRLATEAKALAVVEPKPPVVEPETPIEAPAEPVAEQVEPVAPVPVVQEPAIPLRFKKARRGQ